MMLKPWQRFVVLLVLLLGVFVLAAMGWFGPDATAVVGDLIGGVGDILTF